jgi:hypothetical protein
MKSPCAPDRRFTTIWKLSPSASLKESVIDLGGMFMTEDSLFAKMADFFLFFETVRPKISLWSKYRQ